MKKVFIAFLVLLFACSLTSCQNNRYVKNEFFDDELLSRNVISELPIPEGDILYVKAYGFASPRVYVNDASYSNKNASIYANTVLEYLRSLSFKHLYATSSIKNKIGIIPALEPSYYVKNAETLIDFKNEDENAYFFVYSNGEIKLNDYNEKYIDESFCIKITCNSGTYEYEEESFDYTFFITIFNDYSSFWIEE